MFGWLTIAMVVAVVIELAVGGYLLAKSQVGCSSLCGGSLDIVVTMGWVFGITLVLNLAALVFILLLSKK